MGIKKIFKRKEPTDEELREDLNRLGVSTKSSKQREETFGAFRNYAQQRQDAKPGLAPVNPYAQVSLPSDAAGHNPYADPQPPARGLQSAPNAYTLSNSALNGNAHASRDTPSKNPYLRIQSRPREADELLLNDIPLNTMHTSRRAARPKADDNATLDLNDLPEEDGTLDLGNDQVYEEPVDSEEEEVEAIKQDIRFVKQESLALTRNTLRMAQEADALGTNTLGMLGSQLERLYSAEQNLLLADTQTQLAEEKVKELKRINRLIFVPVAGNPFNKKSRLRQQEEKLKNAKTQEKYMSDTARLEMYQLEQRLKQGITNNATSLDVHQKYKTDRDLSAAKRYQFENDSEDDEMEKEMASNLDQIGAFAKKLKGTANTMGMEVEKQNSRLRKIEEDADRLDIDVMMNTQRLANIR